MSKQLRSQPLSLFVATALLAAGFLLGRYFGPAEATAQRPDVLRDGARETWESRFGFAIPADGAAIIRNDDGRGYLVNAQGEVFQLSIGEAPRDPTPLRPR